MPAGIIIIISSPLVLQYKSSQAALQSPGSLAAAAVI